jgi:hypothetical protein
VEVEGEAAMGEVEVKGEVEMEEEVAAEQLATSSPQGHTPTTARLVGS